MKSFLYHQFSNKKAAHQASRIFANPGLLLLRTEVVVKA